MSHRRLLAAGLLFLALCGFLGFSRGGGVTSGGGSYTGACDTFSDGGKACYSVDQSWVASYGGALFELVQQAPAWTGTGYISGTTFTVSSTATGALSNGLALSAAGSGTTPALTPITYITGGSGPYTVNKSQTAGSSGSPLTMAAYAVYDVPQASHVANLSSVPSFCKNQTCLYLKVFNEASTGAANDLIASNISGGNTYNPNCTASIVTCAPLYWLDTAINAPIVPLSYPAGMETCAGAIPCTTSGIPTGAVSQALMENARPDMFTGCCGGFGKMEAVGSDPSGSMFADFINGNGAVFGCATANTWCVGADLEGLASLVSNSANTSQHNIYDLRYDGSSTLTYLVNNTSVISGAPPAGFPFTSGVYVRLGLAGDRSTAPRYFYGGALTGDSTSHTAAYSNLAAWNSGRSAAPSPGSLDVAFYVNESAPGTYQSALVGNANAGYSLACLSNSYTGPVADLTDSEGSPVTNTYGCINGAIDTAAATFCAANPPCRISGLYGQAPWDPNGGNTSNVYSTALKLTCTGGLGTCPTAAFNSLNGLPVMHFSGSQCLLSSSMSGYIAHVLVPWEIGAVMRRTSGTTFAAGMAWDTTTHYFIGAGNAANTAAFANGQAFGSGTASDNHWHSLIADTTVGSSGTLYVDSVSAGTAGTNAGWTLSGFVTVGCGWSGSAITDPLTGDIAEVWMQHRTSDASGTLTSRISTIFPIQEAFWGGLPN